jgi:plastocyanin
LSWKRVFVSAVLLAGIGLLSLGMVACGDDDEESEGGGGNGNSDAAEYVVVARDFEYSVDEMEVVAGDIVIEFNNQGSAPHTFSIYADEAYTDLAETTGQVNGGVIERFDMSLEAGDYFVRCDVHPSQMTATLTAE